MKQREVISLIFDITNLLERIWNKQVFQKYWLTTTLFKIMSLLDSTSWEISDIRDKLFESAASVTQKVNRLEELWYIQKKVWAIDKRKIMIELTTYGKEVLSQAMVRDRVVSDKLFSDLSSEKISSLGELLETLKSRLSKSQNIKI